MTTTKLLHELTGAEFHERYHTDPFTASVLANRLRATAGHVATGLLHRAFSPIIALAMDYACAVIGPPEQNYRMVSVTNGLTVFLGTLQDGVRVAVEEYGLERLVPGDLLICNDPTRVGTHTNDMCFIRPVFHGGRVVSFMVLRAHVIDIGGITPGGFDTNKKNIYETGLIISPRLLFHAEEPVRETFSMIFDNSRFGEIQLPDYKTIHSCCRLGETMIVESIERYGLDAYLGSLDYSCDATAERMRAAVAALPDGDYHGSATIDADAVDANEEYVVRLAVIKRGDRGRGRLQRLLPPGPHRDQRGPPRCQDRGGRGAQDPAGSAGPLHLRLVPSDRHRPAAGHDRERATPRRRHLLLLGGRQRGHDRADRRTRRSTGGQGDRR